MKVRFVPAIVAILAGLSVTGRGSAEPAYTTASVILRGGPSSNSEVVARIAGETYVDVLGCAEDFAWCHVSTAGIRGWIRSSRLEFDHGGQRLLVSRYRNFFGAPVIGSGLFEPSPPTSVPVPLGSGVEVHRNIHPPGLEPRAPR